MWCQAHPGVVAIEPPISPFLCASCATACIYCNETGQPDTCERDGDGATCSRAIREMRVEDLEMARIQHSELAWIR